MKVSVIVPVFNEQKCIKACLESLQSQKVQPYEIVLVDNNSTDKSVEIAQKYNVRIVPEKKQGMIYARNRGFNTATGDILARCDADSILPPNWIQRIIYDFTKYKIDGVTGPSDFYDLTVVPKYSSFLNAYLEFFKLLRNHYPLRGPNMAITKAIWEKVKGKVCMDDAKVHEDMDLAIHIHQAKGIIRLDKKLWAGTSGRRAKNNPQSFFIEYPVRVIKTLQEHKVD